jgi:hypothetical protein
VLASIFGFIIGFIAYQSYCTFDNPMQIDYAQFWYNEIPVLQLFVASQVGQILSFLKDK